jgi:PTH1 family peptidyl-tRNA hydrolase
LWLLNANSLIVGLGNPGSAYENTRHNMGFRVLRAFAQKNGYVFRNANSMVGELAQGKLEDKKVILLLPMTYMNNSGRAVRLCSDYFEVAVSRVLIVCDDVALPFGELRLRLKGSAGGHNGLKSVEAHLGTTEYPRLRIGVGHQQEGDLADYVLGKFSAEELKLMPEIEEKALERIDLWLRTNN